VPGRCKIYGWVRDVNNQGIDGAKVFFRADEFFHDDDLMLKDVVVETGPSATNPTWAAGYFEVFITETQTKSQNMTCEVKYNELDSDGNATSERLYDFDGVSGEIPNQESIDLETLIENWKAAA
jgi:hypothetical protein